MNNIDRVLRSNLKLKHLQLLVTLDQQRHLGKTAESLAITQPAVSKSLAEIERMFEITLFNRSRKGTEPTLYGESLIRFAKKVLSEFENTKEELKDTLSGSSGKINVGAMVVAMPTLLSPAITRFKKVSSNTRIFVEEGDLNRLLPRLRSGELDILVGRLEPGYAAPDLKSEVLYDQPMCLVVNTSHALAKKRKLSWSELSNSAWVVPPMWASSRTKLIQLFYQHGLNPPHNLIETASFLAILDSVVDRGAIGFVAQEIGLHFQKKGLIKILPFPLKMDLPPVGIITLHGQNITQSTQGLMKHLRDLAQEKKRSFNTTKRIPS